LSDPRRRIARRIIERFEEIASLFGWELDLVFLEEFAERVGRRIAERIPLERLVTKTIDRDDVLIRVAEDLIDSRVRGRLEELVLKTPSTDFRVTMMRNGVSILDRTYTELLEISPYSNVVDAFQEAETKLNILKISNISWLSDFLLTITTPEVKFNKIFIVWQEWV